MTVVAQTRENVDAHSKNGGVSKVRIITVSLLVEMKKKLWQFLPRLYSIYARLYAVYRLYELLVVAKTG